MKLLTTLLTFTLLSSIAAPAFAQRAIEGLDQETYDRNTEILKEGRREMKYETHRDFYYDYKYSDVEVYEVEDNSMDMDTDMDTDEDMMNDMEDDNVIEGAF